MKIGFEIHEQINTATKLYCDSPTNYREEPPNTNVCEVCTGMPGAKPMPVNQEAIDAAVEIALMLDCDVIYDPVYIQRKHYDYPDLPSGYQRTSLPIAKDGVINDIGIWEVHLEEDPGKYDPLTGKVDYNRSGVPLVEIVTAPDITSPEMARGFLRELTKVLEYTGKVRPEGGTMRMDCNISLEGGARVEIKNINSVRGAYKALKFEVTRQRNLMRRGVKVKRETRAYLEAQMITRKMRVKEEAEDYRYIPDPDIPPLVVTQDAVSTISAQMPEAPHMKMRRFMEQYGISRDDAWAITSEIEMADAFEEVCKDLDPKIAGQFFRHDVMEVLHYNDLTYAQSHLTAHEVIEILKLREAGEITATGAELTLRGIVEEGKRAAHIIEEKELKRITKEEVIERAVKEAISESRQAVDDYLGGKGEALDFIMGKVMEKTHGKADPRTILDMLRKSLEATQ
ncbi:MAG: Asp-tRNA(Asn)/Glu-tRNA(Gln) amidotransferase subunit GatB [Candidatus Hydrothermarchaeaceae archaeon]